MNDIKFSNSFAFFELKFRKYSYTDNRAGSPSHYFAYMLNGNAKIVTEYDTVTINEGDIFYIPDKCSYQSYWYGKPDIKFISLGFHYFPNFENEKYNPQTIPYCEEAARLFRSISEDREVTAATIGRFYTLVGILVPKMKTAPPCRSAEIVRKTTAYLCRYPHSDNSMLAKHCTVSEAALYAAFNKSSDETPAVLRNRIILEKARELLITTDKTIEDISDTMQFSSPSYFRKKFKQHFGITPGQMRKRNGI